MTDDRSGCALVIGGTGGIGGAACRRLAADGWRVVVGYRSGGGVARSIADEINGATVHCDLDDAASVEAAFAAAGTIAAVVFAGGVAIDQPYVSAIDEASWRQVIETELIGFTRVVRAAIPRLRANGGGAIVAVTSVATVSYPSGDALSAVPKAAIGMLGRAVAKEEGRHGIRCNMVAPGIIDGGLGATFLATLYTPGVWEGQRRRIALRRFGHVDEVADAVAFLAGPGARYITGQTLVVDGGFSL